MRRLDVAMVLLRKGAHSVYNRTPSVAKIVVGWVIVSAECWIDVHSNNIEVFPEGDRLCFIKSMGCIREIAREDGAYCVNECLPLLCIDRHMGQL